jgi:hypothetical protein
MRQTSRRYQKEKSHIRDLLPAWSYAKYCRLRIKLMLNRFGSYITLARKYMIEWKLETLYGTTKECVLIEIESWLG